MFGTKKDSIINGTDSLGSKTSEIVDMPISNDNASVSQIKKESNENNWVISKEPIAPLTFYKNNKDLINLQQGEFKEWLKINYIAISGTGQFIPTDFAEENGYMINDIDYKMIPVIKKKSKTSLIKIIANYSGKLTKEGQEFILDLIEKENEVKSNVKG